MLPKGMRESLLAEFAGPVAREYADPQDFAARILTSRPRRSLRHSKSLSESYQCPARWSEELCAYRMCLGVRGWWEVVILSSSLEDMALLASMARGATDGLALLAVRTLAVRLARVKGDWLLYRVMLGIAPRSLVGVRE